MPSERQIAANRANAKRSTGPRTPGGKARSRTNSLSHGLAATRRTSSPSDSSPSSANLSYSVGRDTSGDGIELGTRAFDDLVTAEAAQARLHGRLLVKLCLRDIEMLVKVDRYVRRARNRVNRMNERMDVRDVLAGAPDTAPKKTSSAGEQSTTFQNDLGT